MDWVIGLPKVTQNGKAFNAVPAFTDREKRMVHFIPTFKIRSEDDTADGDVMF